MYGSSHNEKCSNYFITETKYMGIISNEGDSRSHAVLGLGIG